MVVLRSLIIDDSLLVTGGRRDSADNLIFGLAQCLVIYEKEQLILEDRAAGIHTKVVANKLGRHIRQAAAQLGFFVEPVVCDGKRGSVIPVRCTVKLVGPGLGHHVHLGSGRAPLIRRGKTGGDAKLFDGVLSLAQDARECIAIHLVIVVNAVHGDVALIGPASVDRAAAGIVRKRRIDGPAGVGTEVKNAGLQSQQIRDISTFAGQRLDERVVHGIAE